MKKHTCYYSFSGNKFLPFLPKQPEKEWLLQKATAYRLLTKSHMVLKQAALLRSVVSKLSEAEDEKLDERTWMSAKA